MAPTCFMRVLKLLPTVRRDYLKENRAERSVRFFHDLFHGNAHGAGGNDLQSISRQKRENAGGKRSRKRGVTLETIPCGAESVQYRSAENHSQRIAPETLAFFNEKGGKKSTGEITDQITSRGTDQTVNPAGKAGKYRKPYGSEQQINRDGSNGFFCIKQYSGEIDCQRCQGDRNRTCRYGKGGGNAKNRRKQCNEYQIFCFQKNLSFFDRIPLKISLVNLKSDTFCDKLSVFVNF